jgi:hypothetical protein
LGSPRTCRNPAPSFAERALDSSVDAGVQPAALRCARVFASRGETGTRTRACAGRSHSPVHFASPQDPEPALRSALTTFRTFAVIASLLVTHAGCVADHHSMYNPPVDQSLSTCPTIVDPAMGVTIDTDVGPKLVATSGEGLSVEYSSGGLWHLQTTCSKGYQCGFEVTAEVFSGSVGNITGEDLEPSDMIGSSCPDTAYMMVTTAGDVDGMTFTTDPGAKVRVTALLDHMIFANLIYWAENGKVRHDGSNPMDLTPATP